MSSALKAVYRVQDEETGTVYKGIRIIHFIKEFKAITDLFKRFYGVYINEDKIWFFREEDYKLLREEISIEDTGKYGTLKIDIDFGIGVLEKSRESRKLKESRVVDNRSREEVISDLKTMMKRRAQCH